MRSRLFRLRSVLAGASVLLPNGAGSAMTQLPEECACCGQPATHRAALTRRGGASLQVGYCEECAEHQASATSRLLASGLASLLLSLVAAAALPLLAPQLGMLAMVLLVLCLSLLPLGFAFFPLRAAAKPHSARGLAVQWPATDQLWCAAPTYAARVAELNGGRQQNETRREPLSSAWLSAGPVIGIGAACLSFFVYHPLLRVLNLGTVRIEVAIDGKPQILVDPTSNESPSAGALLRVPAGEHSLSVASTIDSALLGRMQANFHSGAVHLLAFDAADTCFWLETTGYGQERLAASSYEPLRSFERFQSESSALTVWVLPGGIDTWFAANPSPSEPSSHSSGGLLTALRQAPCAEAPQEVRAAR